jgi:hypothetical protein
MAAVADTDPAAQLYPAMQAPEHDGDVNPTVAPYTPAGHVTHILELFTYMPTSHTTADTVTDAVDDDDLDRVVVMDDDSVRDGDMVAAAEPEGEADAEAVADIVVDEDGIDDDDMDMDTDGVADGDAVRDHDTVGEPVTVDVDDGGLETVRVDVYDPDVVLDGDGVVELVSDFDAVDDAVDDVVALMDGIEFVPAEQIGAIQLQYSSINTRIHTHTL